MPSPDDRLSLSNPSQDRDPSALELLILIMRGWRTVVRVAVSTIVVVALVIAIWPKRYSASAVFMPQVPGNALSSLSGVAAQFGLTVPTQDPTQSPDFYSQFATSHNVLSDVVTTVYAVTDGDSVRHVDLVTLWDESGRTPDHRRENAITDLKKVLSASTDRQVGVVTITMQDHNPEVAYQVVQRVLSLVNEFNLVTRQSQAGQERSFIASRRDTAEAELRAAENGLQAFLIRNRDFSSSPSLRFDYDRLNREVTIRQDVFTTLAQSYEQARIEEVRNTPVITVVEPPELPVLPDRRHAILKILLGAILGVVAAIGLVVGRHWLRQAELVEPGMIAELRRHGRDVLISLRVKRAS